MSRKGLNAELTALVERSVRGARIEQTRLPLVPEIELFLLNEDYPQHALSDEEIRWLMDNPAYWCFCWASGQVLARFVLDNPHWVAGKTVMDFGCGSAVVGVAAALAGAERVIACDLDADALRASALNAALNDVTLDYVADANDYEGPCDLLIVADVLYDRANLPLLKSFLQRADEVLLADSRIRDFSEPGYVRMGGQRAFTVPDLAESEEFSHVSLYYGGHRQITGTTQ
ncbi:methyltransferase [Litorivivens sp.]|uniref:class I SAM-dependent methyltransferase n=1 Tax=Litorivivens sp. TaxID=2020868 RepID=UPI003563FFAC